MQKCYLFDFDGTLVDSMPAFASAMLRILDECGISYDNSIIKTITPLGLNGTVSYYRHNLGVPLSSEALIEKMQKYLLEAYLYTIPAKSHVPTVLRELKSRGASLNVLTASTHVTLDPCLKRLGLWELFDNVWSCDDFHTTKTDPNIYVTAAQKLGYPVKEVLFLDDNLEADKTAKAAGMTVCGVYDDSSREYTDQIRSITDYYIFDFQELLSI